MSIGQCKILCCLYSVHLNQTLRYVSVQHAVSNINCWLYTISFLLALLGHMFQPFWVTLRPRGCMLTTKITYYNMVAMFLVH